jgi:hypothetical protein
LKESDHAFCSLTGPLLAGIKLEADAFVGLLAEALETVLLRFAEARSVPIGILDGTILPLADAYLALTGRGVLRAATSIGAGFSICDCGSGLGITGSAWEIPTRGSRTTAAFAAAAVTRFETAFAFGPRTIGFAASTLIGPILVDTTAPTSDMVVSSEGFDDEAAEVEVEDVN